MRRGLERNEMLILWRLGCAVVVFVFTSVCVLISGYIVSVIACSFFINCYCLLFSVLAEDKWLLCEALLGFGKLLADKLA